MGPTNDRDAIYAVCINGEYIPFGSVTSIDISNNEDKQLYVRLGNGKWVPVNGFSELDILLAEEKEREKEREMKEKVNVFIEDGDLKTNEAGIKVYESMTDKQKEFMWEVISCAIKDTIAQIKMKDHKSHTIDHVKFSGPATIIFWKDGDKTVVKCMKEDTFNPEVGIMVGMLKKMFGSSYRYFKKDVKKWVEEHNKQHGINEAPEAEKYEHLNTATILLNKIAMEGTDENAD